ncbi:alpha/beta hydrolase fold domain-containing protein [Rhizobium sp. KVB221]|uniref:Alpha/beta hydrolase fold domain-containing protein n=1 Tax=Rhizobium setariae TaxID=2801340 RepID=A0A936YN21_9HYPH|nr:alpha/beta hydrolase fold domain-containing protein [Rhizobium setariae]MBL0373453.1 alpha/beta hydrolase fold domain-containing protein [Rhizobium setariae]
MSETDNLVRNYPHLDAATVGRLAMLTDGPPFDLASVPVAVARELASRYLTEMGNGWAPTETLREVHQFQAGLEAHVFQARQTLTDAAPLVIWFHGGGWVFGSASLHAPWAREIAKLANCLLVDVDYPLAPEASCGEMLEACVASVRWCAETISSRFGSTGRRKILIGGESSGAHLALLTGAALGPSEVDGIVAVNPITDLRANRGVVSALRNAK